MEETCFHTMSQFLSNHFSFSTQFFYCRSGLLQLNRFDNIATEHFDDVLVWKKRNNVMNCTFRSLTVRFTHNYSHLAFIQYVCTLVARFRSVHTSQKRPALCGFIWLFYYFKIPNFFRHHNEWWMRSRVNGFL